MSKDGFILIVGIYRLPRYSLATCTERANVTGRIQRESHSEGIDRVGRVRSVGLASVGGLIRESVPRSMRGSTII